MSRRKVNIAIAHTKELCPVCAAEVEGPLVRNKFPTEAGKKKIEEIDGKIIGWRKVPCDTCMELMDRAYILVGVIDAKTTDPKHPYRSGNTWGVKKEAAALIVNEQQMLRGYAFIDLNIAEKLNLPDIQWNA